MSSALSKGLTGAYTAGETGWGTTMDNNLADINNWLHEQWGQDRANTSGTTYGYMGGTVLNSSGAWALIAAGTIALTDNATNYVERTAAGTVSKNTSAFTATKIPMAKVTTVSGAITAVVDQRPMLGQPGAGQTFAIPYTIGDSVNEISTGVQGDVEIPFACTIIAVRLLADQSGSIVVDIWKDTYANLAPTVADTITASAKPTLSSASKYEDTTLTGWTTSVAAGDWLRFNVDSITTCTRVVVSLTCRRT